MFRHPIVQFLAIWFSSGVTTAAETRPADLFPATTLAYAELTDPIATADAVAKYVKGTPFADALDHLHTRRDQTDQPTQMEGITRAGIYSLLTSPEALADFKRIRGVAAGLTGFDAKSGAAQVALVVLTGESLTTGLLARAYLLTSERVRRVGKVDGVAIYQNRLPTARLPEEAQDTPLKARPPEPMSVIQGEYEATYLYAPGLLIMGSSPAAVADVYRRYRGDKHLSPSLGSSADFSAAATVGKSLAGLQLFARPQSLEKAYDAARRERPGEFLSHQQFAILQFAFAPQQLATMTGQLKLNARTLSLSVSGELRDPARHPAAQMLTGPQLDPTRQRFDRDSHYAFALSMPAKDDRSPAALALADAVAGASGRLGELPSEIARPNRDRPSIDELLRRTTTLGIHLPLSQELAKKTPTLPTLTFELEDGPTATTWFAAVPGLISRVSGSDSAGTSQEVVGKVRVASGVGKIGTLDVPYHMARVDEFLVVGLDRKRVAAQCDARNDGKAVMIAEGLLHKDPQLYGVVGWNWLLEPHLTKALTATANSTPAINSRTAPLSIASVERIQRLIGNAPPVVVQMGRKGNSIWLEATTGNLWMDAPKLIEALWLWLEANHTREPGENMGFRELDGKNNFFNHFLR